MIKWSVNHVSVWKPSHIINVCVYSNHAKFQSKQAQILKISMLAPCNTLINLYVWFFMLEFLVSIMFEFGNPPTPSMHASSLTMPNFSPSKHKFKKFQRWPCAVHDQADHLGWHDSCAFPY